MKIGSPRYTFIVAVGQVAPVQAPALADAPNVAAAARMGQGKLRYEMGQ